MEKKASTDYPVHELIRRRWSPRAFSADPVGDDLIRSVLEAARWAASAMNEQPWCFIVATQSDPVEHKRLVDVLAPGNQRWAAKAPLLMLSVAKLHFDRSGKSNRHAFHDVGLATAQLILQALAHGLFAHPMGGFDREKACQIYHIPDGYEPVAALAVGFPGDPDRLPDDLKERELAPRRRLRQTEVVFWGEWGQSWQ